MARHSEKQRQPDPLPDDLIRVTICAERRLWAALWKEVDKRETETGQRIPLVTVITDILTVAVRKHYRAGHTDTSRAVAFPFHTYRADPDMQVMRSFRVPRHVWEDLSAWKVQIGFNLKDVVTSVLYTAVREHYKTLKDDDLVPAETAKP